MEGHPLEMSNRLMGMGGLCRCSLESTRATATGVPLTGLHGSQMFIDGQLDHCGYRSTSQKDTVAQVRSALLYKVNTDSN